jgi:hypothetical protein
MSKTSAMPTETWKSDSLSSLLRGKSAVAASAKGKKRELTLAQARMNFWVAAVIR